MRLAVLPLLCAGCLIVHTYEEVDEPCPAVEPQLVVDAVGPFAIAGDTLYFMRTEHILAKRTAGEITDLAFISNEPQLLAVDASYAYLASTLASAGTIFKAPLSGGYEVKLLDAQSNLGAFVVDDVGVVYSDNGLHRFRHDTMTIEDLADGEAILGIAPLAGTYYFTNVIPGLVRRTPPLVDLTTALYPTVITADDRGVYYVEQGEPERDMGAIRVIDPGGGTPGTVAAIPQIAVQMVMDDTDLFVLTASEQDYRIRRVPRSGGEDTLLACGFAPATPYLWLDQDAVYVYFSGDHRSIKRLDKTTFK